MARKWSNLNLPGRTSLCNRQLHQSTAKLISYVLMPDHFHFISNPRDGCIIEFCRDLKSKAAKAIIEFQSKATLE
jgi:REP element-mobilizing transposase RayT